MPGSKKGHGIGERRPLLALGLATLFLVAVVVWAVVILVHAFPPRTVRMATGPRGEADDRLGEQYRAILARKGVDLQLVATAGKAENLARLKDPKSGIQVGFVSGGLTTAADAPHVVSLGTIGYDPLWIFCRGVPEPVQFSDLEGKKVAIGPEGSGTRALALELFRKNGLDKVVQPVPLPHVAAGDALERGEIACACMLTYAESPEVRKLFADEHAVLMAYPRADAYAALFPFLRKVVLPTGVFDLAANRPPHDVPMIADAESLLVRESLHPAIQYLLLEAAEQIHSGAGILQRPAQFPAAEPVDVPLSDEARQFYKSGGNFLQRHLPFWLWVFASRLLVVLVPLLGAVYPLVQLVPSAIAFEMERRIDKLYEELRGIEGRMDAPGARMEELDRELDAFDERVRTVRVPASYARTLYTLKHHASLVRGRLAKRAPVP